MHDSNKLQTHRRIITLFMWFIRPEHVRKKKPSVYNNVPFLWHYTERQQKLLSIKTSLMIYFMLFIPGNLFQMSINAL